jgi:hypothetical protein
MKNFFDQNLQFTYVQAKGEAFSLQKRISSTSKKGHLFTFFYVCEFFLLFWIRTQIANPDPDTDPGAPLNPDPQLCFKVWSSLLVSSSHEGWEKASSSVVGQEAMHGSVT